MKESYPLIIEAKASDATNQHKLKSDWLITHMTKEALNIQVLFERPQMVSTQGLNELDSLSIKFTSELRDLQYGLPIDTYDF